MYFLTLFLTLYSKCQNSKIQKKNYEMKKNEKIFDQQLLNELKACFWPYRTALMIPISLIFAIISLLLFNDPPTFPLPPGSDVVDCANIDVTKLYTEKSRIKLELKTREFIQYPREVASSLIEIVTDVNGFQQIYKPQQYWDLESDLETVKFCVLQTFGGGINTSVYCNDRIIKTAYLTIDTIDIYPIGWSRLMWMDCCLAKLTDINWHKRNITFSSQPKTKVNRVRLSYNFICNMKTDTRKGDAVRQSMTGKTIDKLTIAIGAEAKTVFEKIIDIIIPWYDNYISIKYSKHNIYIPNEKSNQDDIFSKLQSTVTVLNREPPYFFTDIRILKSSGSSMWPDRVLNQTIPQYQKEQLDYITKTEKDLQYLRQLFINNQNIKAAKGKVVIDERIEKSFKSIIEKECNIKTITLYDNDSFDTVINKMKDAQVFVTGHIKSAVCCFLMPQQSTLIEVKPDSSSCTSFANWFAKNANLKRIEVKSNGPCKCKDFACHLSETPNYSKVDKNLLISSIKSTLSQ